MDKLILLLVLIRILPFLLLVETDLTDEAADEVDDGERISIGTAWCKDTILELVGPWELLLMIFPFPWFASRADDELLLPPEINGIKFSNKPFHCFYLITIIFI